MFSKSEEPLVNEDHSVNVEELLELVKIKKPSGKEALLMQYRTAVDTWEKVLRSDKNNKYAERLQRATNRMDRLRKILQDV